MRPVLHLPPWRVFRTNPGFFQGLGFLFIHGLGAFILCGLLLGCTAATQQSHPHIVVDKDGYALSDDGKRMSEDAYSAHIDRILSNVETYVQTTQAQGKAAKLMVFVHGGLTGTDEGLNYIEKMVDPINGHLKGTDLYPIFINWDSSLWSSLWDDLFMVRLGNRHPVIGVLTSPFIIVSRLVDGVVNLPVTLVYHYDTEKMQFESWRGEQRSTGELVSNGALTVVSLPTTLASLPLISGYGKGAWAMMRRRIDQMVAHQRRPLEHYLFKKSDKNPGALRQLFERVEKYVQQHSINSDTLEVTLVGHSMGAIVVNRLLRDFPSLEFDRVIYMGAAASIDDFITTIPPYLSRVEKSRFYSFSLSNSDEAGEFNWFLPRGSLLVWIDNIYEPGLSATGKRVGFFRNRDAMKVRPKSDDICTRMHFIKFPGLPGDPLKHGQFNDDVVLQRILNIADSTSKEQIKAACENCEVPGPCIK